MLEHFRRITKYARIANANLNPALHFSQALYLAEYPEAILKEFFILALISYFPGSFVVFFLLKNQSSGEVF